ncbi:translesion error-prone DNA polymerase V autoproteolytic subunit [Zoogloea oleivorans]|uniref:Translesion error-prone DNA polymerase V autoproteolytic subunit n=1 Tax=Zoogloea oleivorans TaxID=1552750 RepID=A0A6C2CJ03_9RHOO|nr:S24 family peptidase [Zoogloea oleivorans]TYC53964.1 translesion error-prone DNA polymerase V autoproteolytic subunit [Zoogloea oleivorans]
MPTSTLSCPEDFPDHRFPCQDQSPQAFPLGLTPVSAGFPSPAEDYADRSLDINDYLVRNPVSTFFFPVNGDSMEGAEIFNGDILVVDRSIRPVHGHIVVAFLNGERLVKRLHQRGGQVALVAENPAYPTIALNEALELVIWGVVVGKFKRFGA